jgi:hypothetical protein
MKKQDEYKKFENLSRKLLGVPHAEIKNKLDAEKTAKKRKKLKVSGASRDAV